MTGRKFFTLRSSAKTFASFAVKIGEWFLEGAAMRPAGRFYGGTASGTRGSTLLLLHFFAVHFVDARGFESAGGANEKELADIAPMDATLSLPPS